MSFIAIQPAAQTGSGAPGIRTLRKPKSGEVFLMLSLPKATMARAGWSDVPRRLSVLVGDGADRGKLRIVEGDPALKVTVLKGTAVIRLPRQDWMPSIDFEREEITVRCAERQITIDLPEWAYDAERQRAIDLARKQLRAGHGK